MNKPEPSKFYYCESCKKFLTDEGRQLFMEAGILRCSGCKGEVKEAQVHISKRGGGYRS